MVDGASVYSEDKNVRITEDQEFGDFDDETPSRNLITEPYTRIKLPTFKEQREGNPISKAEAKKQMLMLYRKQLRRFVNMWDIYRSYSVENIKAKLEQDISDNYDLFMGRNEGNFASKSDFINTISALKRNAAEDIRVVRNAHNINFRASGSMAEIMNEYYKAYEDNTIAGRLFFDERGELPGVEAQHAALLKRIEAGEFGGEDPNIKRLNIELFNERTFANTGTVAVDVMLDAKTWISANTNYYELLDTFTKKYGRQYESLLGIGPIENYTQLIREIGILDRMEDEYLLSGDPSKRAQYRTIAKRLSTARKLQNRVTRETGKERDRMRARNKELDANLIIIGK